MMITPGEVILLDGNHNNRYNPDRSPSNDKAFRARKQVACHYFSTRPMGFLPDLSSS